MHVSRKRIFVVSDKEVLSAALSGALSDLHFLQEQLIDLAYVRAAVLRSKPHLLILEITAWTQAVSNLLWELGEVPALAASRKLVLCTRATGEEKIAALEVGADQFLLKPISVRELRANLDALLRSNTDSVEEQIIVSVGSLVINRTEMSVTVEGNATRLTATEFSIVEFLALREGHMISRQELLENIWPEYETQHGTRLVEVYIYRVRGKIETNPSSPRRLLQFRGKGYTLINPDLDNSSQDKDG
jgi:DNA-binding response OmpR family regulator